MKHNLKKIESTHCKTVRLLALHGPLQNFHFGAHEMFKNMSLLKTEDIYKLEMAKFMYRMYHKQLPNAFNNYFTRIDSMHTYQLRSVKNKVFYTKTASTKQYKSWVSHAGVELWSKIDPSIKELSFKSFSLQLKKDWINEY